MGGCQCMQFSNKEVRPLSIVRNRSLYLVNDFWATIQGENKSVGFNNSKICSTKSTFLKLVMNKEPPLSWTRLHLIGSSKSSQRGGVG